MITEQEGPIDVPPEHSLTASEGELEIINREHFRAIRSASSRTIRSALSGLVWLCRSTNELLYLWSSIAVGPLPSWYTGWDTVYLKAYRAYANYLNWHRPRGHKLSWRRLNRVQRAEALTWYARLVEIGGLAWRG